MQGPKISKFKNNLYLVLEKCRLISSCRYKGQKRGSYPRIIPSRYNLYSLIHYLTTKKTYRLLGLGTKMKHMHKKVEFRQCNMCLIYWAHRKKINWFADDDLPCRMLCAPNVSSSYPHLCHLFGVCGGIRVASHPVRVQGGYTKISALPTDCRNSHQVRHMKKHRWLETASVCVQLDFRHLGR